MAQLRATSSTTRLPDPNEKLVKVFDTEQESEAMVVKGLLESASIECDLTATSTAQDPFPGLGGAMILVRQEDAELARRVIAEFQQSPEAGDDQISDDDETSEIDLTTGKPPTKA